MRHPHDGIRIRIRKGFDDDCIDDAEDRRRRADPERERQDGRGGEGSLLGERARGVAQVLPEIREQASRRGARRDGGRRVRLPQRGDALREHVAGSELGERHACRLVRRCAGRRRLAVAFREVLRDFVDDVGLALRLQAQRREPRADLALSSHAC